MEELRPAPSLQTLDDLVETTFTVDGNDDVEVRLRELETSRDVVDDWEQFTLVFDCLGGTTLDGKMYRLVDKDGEWFDLTLSPTPNGSSDPDDVHYEAPLSREVPGRVASGGSGDAPKAENADVGAPQLSVEQIVGGIEMFAGTFAPKGFMMCDGRQLLLQNYNALYSLLGTTYGGDGQRVFRVPDLTGRTAIGAGQGTGRTPRDLGETGGEEAVGLTTNELPTHTHRAQSTLPVSRSQGNSGTPGGHHLARSEDVEIYADSSGADMSVETTIRDTGEGMPHGNMPPYLAINYVIAVQGYYPQQP
ncbi:phage tail protein [Natrarchaeobius sp. A-rgal3]|uniref:phage tail protein n=1 Tax=Natrarchaeobius versutus TaxID=1679078 RepID=UPI00350FD27D